MVDIRTLQPHPENPNIHTKEQILLLSKIIKNNGWRDRIIVSNRSGLIIRGHGRLDAAKLLEVRRVPVEYQDYESKAAEYRDLIADNKISEFSYVDKSKVMELISEIESIDAKGLLGEIGFAKSEIDELLANAEEVGEDEVVDNYAPQYGVIVLCSDEAEQADTYDYLIGRGYKCKVVAT
jgi:ParB-like chromosome segregation protein Spo0J